METKIASYQEPGKRIQLIKISKLDYPEYPELAKEIIKYQIRINRKIYFTSDNIRDSKLRMRSYIYNHLSQTEINYEK